jgi:hypothetical protein
MMNKKLLNPLGVLVTAIVIGVTAGCATVQTAFAPGVAEAKAADGSSFSGALVPGSIDLGMSPEAGVGAARLKAMAQYYAAKQAAGLERGRSAESARLDGMAKLFVVGSAGGALVPGSVDLQISKAVASSLWTGALIPGSLELQISNESVPSFYNSALVPGSIDLQIAR